MEQVLLTARSITHAQRMRSVLGAVGIHGRMDRAPLELTMQGCTYALRLPSANLTQAMTVLQQSHLKPLRIYVFRGGRYREVNI